MTIYSDDPEAWVPENWLTAGDVEVSIGAGSDLQWQTFFAIFIASTVLCWAWNSVKHPDTALHDDKLIQAYLLTIVLIACSLMCVYFGSLGINPALASAYITFYRS